MNQTSSTFPAFKALGLTDAKGVATPGTDDVGPGPAKSASCVERQNGKESERKMIFSLEKN